MIIRQRNPPLGIVLLSIAGGLVLAGTTIAVVQGSKSSKAKKKEVAPTPTPTPTPAPTPKPEGGGGGGGGNYIGGNPNYAWPHKDKFPTVRSLLEWLAMNGYPAQWTLSVTTTPNMDAITQFQEDFNIVRGYMLSKKDPGKVAKVPALSPDGRIGNNTVNGMWAITQDGLGWQQAVTHAVNQDIYEWAERNS